MEEPDPDKLRSLTDIAKRLGIAPATAKKMLKPVRVSESGRRYFTLRSVRDQLQDDGGEAA